MDIFTLRRSLAFDPVLRVIHVWNAALLCGLVASGELAALFRFDWPVAGLWRLHVWLGYGLALGLAARLAWGLAGPVPARLAMLWQPAEWKALALHRRRLATLGTVGERPAPLAALLHLVTYVATFVAALSGFAWLAVRYGEGPLSILLGFEFDTADWIIPLHDGAARWFWFFIPVHMAALWWHEHRDGVPVASGMISGYRYRR